METLTFDKEESLLRGYIPLGRILDILKSGEKVDLIDFGGNGYCTDAVLHLLGRQSPVIFSKLVMVNLRGCYLLSDYGLKSLLKVLKPEDHKSLDICLDGCVNVGDNTLAAVNKVTQMGWSMKSSGVNHLSCVRSKITTQGSPTLWDSAEPEEAHKHGQVLVVPHPALTRGFGKFLHSGESSEKQSSYHEPSWEIDGWHLAVTDVSLNSCLFDEITNTELSQVVIPFDASSEPKEIKRHVMSTISRVIAKHMRIVSSGDDSHALSKQEPVRSEFPDIVTSTVTTTMSDEAWMDVHLVDRILLSSDNVLQSICASDRNIGAYVSHTPMTRSNHYFEVECVGGAKKVALLIGVLHDRLYSWRHPMDSEEDKGGVVDGFEIQPGEKIGFGIEGEWHSEYVPYPSAKYYFIENNEKKEGKDPTNIGIPQIGMFPLISILGEEYGEIQLPPLVSAPEDLSHRWQKENRWIEKGYMHNCLVDTHGVVSYFDNYNSPGQHAKFLSRLPVSQQNNLFTVRIDSLHTKELPEFTKAQDLGIWIGVINESSKDPVCAYISTTKCVKFGGVSNIDARDQLPDFKVGDEVTVKIDRISGQFGIVTDTCNLYIEFLVNGKSVYKREDWQYTLKYAGSMMVPFIALHEKGDRVTLKNYHTTYRKPAPLPEQVTMGRSHFINPMDSGELEYSRALMDKTAGKEYGMFMGKTPISRSQLQFNVEVQSLNNNAYFAIGLVHSDYPVNQFIGWRQNSIAYHADNGRIYCNSSSGEVSGLKVDPDVAVIKSGSKVGVRVEPIDNKTPLKFDKDGTLAAHQKMKIVFTKDDIVIHEYTEFRHVAESLHPAVSLRDTENRVKVLNFYPETNELWESLDSQKQEKAQANLTKKKKKKEKKDSPEKFSGTEFLVVGVGGGSSDPAGKLQLVKGQIDLHEGWAELKAVMDSVSDMESHLNTLDLQEQQNYAHLCAVQDNMKQLASNPKRIKYRTVDMDSKKGLDVLQSDLVQIQNSYQLLQPHRFAWCESSVKAETLVVELIGSDKVVKYSAVITALASTLDGNQVTTLLKEMHSLGKLILLNIGMETIIAEPGFLFTLEEKMARLLPTAMLQTSTTVTSIGQSSHVWDSEAMTQGLLSGVPSEKHGFVKDVLQKVFALISLECLRTQPGDELCVYTTQQNVSNPPVPMSDYWSSTKDTKDFIVISRTYKFPTTLPEYILPLIISSTVKYGRVVILTGDGVVYQNGATQTVIVNHLNTHGDKVIVIESRCYMPDLESMPDTKVSKETTSYVRDYTWNVFCIYTDVIDDLLRRENVVTSVMKKQPDCAVNVSVGCKHRWIYRTDNVMVTVCTLCNRCCDKGAECRYNGIMGTYLRACGCGTEVVGCKDCGICISCAEELWNIRSRLRPYATSTTSVRETILQKTAKKSAKDGVDGEDKDKKMLLNDPTHQPNIPLDSFLYNEMEFQNLSSEPKILCLREESDGTMVQAFPGKASYIQGLETVSLSKAHEAHYNMQVGDNIKVKITDPLGASHMTQMELESKEEVVEVEPQWFAVQCREMKVIHETGIVVYDTNSSSLPVAQFIGCKPMTKDNNTFSVKVLSTGKKATIAIGLVPKNYPPNRQPGWNVQSVGYHADDGGVFLESGWPTRKTKTAKDGDIMSLYIDFDTNKGFFRRNGEQCIELNLNPSRLGYYPCVGLHSQGEAVQLLEKDLWRAETSEDRALNPPAYPTYKYGNLWISPGKKITMTKLSSIYSGWLMLHNPSKETVGFKVKYGKADEDAVFGMLQYKADWVRYIEKSNTTAKKNIIPMKEMPKSIVVEWTSLESGRTYKDVEIKEMFGTGSEKINQSSHQHVLPIHVIESASVLDELPTLTTMPAPKEKTMLCLQIYKNMSLVDEYWLKYGTYYLTVETNSKSADFLLKYPKCPNFQFPRCIQKGMKVTLCIDDSKVYAECIVVDMYGGGKMLALEYSPKNSSVNTTICVMADSNALKFADFNGDESNVLVYQARNTPANLTKTFVWAPPYLLSEGGRKCLEYLDPEWKANTLRAFSQCTQVFTRLTVQEHQINNASKVIIGWLKGESNYMYSYLPDHLSIHTMAYPQGHTMFRDIAVHRMCFSAEELAFLVGMEEDFRWRVPLHFVDIAGIKPSSPLPLEMLYVNNPTAWTYVSLIGDKLLLPSYSNMIEGDMGSYTRKQIEQLLYNMCQIYASICGIYSARVGGLEYTEVSEGSSNMPDYIKHGDKNVVRFTGNFHVETHMLIKHSGIMTCKAHAMNTGVNDQKYPGKIKFDYDYFEPYMDTVSSFFWCHSQMESLPSDFFQKFTHLQLLSIGDRSGKHMYKFKGLPEGIADAKELKLVELCNNSMSELPSDFFMSPTTTIVRLSNMPIKKLPKHWSQESKITELILQGLLIRKVPSEIEYLQELTHLELCYNPITDLPESMAALKKLHSLSLHGSPWITMEGKRSQITYEQYMSWMHTNSSIKFSLGEEVVEKLFHEFDYNHNASLDEEETAGLNLKLFFDIPHIGIKDLNDEVTGGIPTVIFQLKSLNHLYLDYQAITMVPQSINNLQNLITLSLNHNPLLESLPGSLGHLPNIKRIQLQSCPMLRTPPNEVVSRGFESVNAYLKRLAGGFTECRRTKLMVVGLGGAGKTSLLRALMSEKKRTSGTEKEIPTDGIDIVPWSVPAGGGQEVTFSTWDFAGQAVYYNTHQFFLSKRAVYLLLWSMRQGYEHAGLDFWLSSISCHAPGTPILVVGTQCDLIPQAEIPEKELMERYPQIASFHRVSSITGTGIADLQAKLLDVTLAQGYMGEKIPQVWLNFEKRILVERQTKKNYLKWDVARAFAMEAGIYDEKDVRLAVQLLHDLGTLQYFDNDFLQDYVVINPQWIVNVMACVVSAQDSPIQKHKGRFLHKDIAEIWKDYDEELRPWLLRLTEDFDLTFPLPKQPLNIVPCLLPTEEPEDLKWPSVRQQKGVRETKMEYRFTYLPSGLFNRAQVRLFQFSNGEQVWKKGSLLSKNRHLALIKQTDDKNLVVLVQGPRPENILFLIHEVFESIIEESFNGVSYDYHVPCPDCVIKEGTYDPFMLNAKLVQRGVDLKAPFIQCYKYFHWISMAQLQEKMPTDSRETSDFDFHLQQSIVALQELNHDLIIDTAIIYSSADLPGPGEDSKLSPRKIRDDVVEWGYQCWFAEDMDNISYVELTAAAKNCKVLIVLISDAFDRDTKCRDMFLYAKETMNKDIIIVVLSENMEWQNKDLGMKIGNQERLLMAKTLKRYMVEGGRRAEFKDWLDEKLTDTKCEGKDPDVFISYNWSNSRNATEKSGRQIPGALGWADPRQIKAVLQEAGITCWIDIENVGKEKKGIFADMAAGMRNSKMMLACISDEYADSDNCMMELRFGILNMDLPLVVAVTGTGNVWKESEVAMLLRRAKAPEVYLQKENAEGFNSLVKFIKGKLMDITLKGKTKKEPGKDPIKPDQRKKEQDKASNIAYQEEYELIQRKFMRHIIGAISNVDSIPLPRLIVVDFVKSVKPKDTSEGRSSRSMQQSMKSRKMLRPKSSTKSRDRLQVDSSVFDDDDTLDWQSESFCLKLLCEHEEGWHMCDGKFLLAFRNRDALETFFKKITPYLYRIYSILKQGPIKLKCFVSGKGDTFHNWIQSESEESHTDFVGALSHLRSELVQDEASTLLNCLARCRLPSGKIVWLCPRHQKWEHVSKLSTRSIGAYNIQKVLFSEDKLLMENLEKSAAYKKLKAIKSTKVAPKLPPPIPMPTYEPKASMMKEEPKPRPPEPQKEEIQDEDAMKEEPKPELNKPSEPSPNPNFAPLTDKGNKSTPTLIPELDEGADKTEKGAGGQLEQDHHAKTAGLQPSHGTDQSDQQNRSKSIIEKMETEDNKAVENHSNQIDPVKDNQETKTKHVVNKAKITKSVEENKEDDKVKKHDPRRGIKAMGVDASSKKDGLDSLYIQPSSAGKAKVYRKVSTSIQPDTIRKTYEKRKDFQQQQSKGNLIKGSTLARSISNPDEKLSRGSTRSSESSQNVDDLTLSLNVNTVTKSSNGSSGNKPHSEKKKASTNKNGEMDFRPLDRVRPKKIKVQPRNEASGNQQKRPSLKATGTAVGLVAGSQMALPERTNSKACCIQ